MESVMKIEGFGDKVWRNADGQPHRIDGPAIEYADGTKDWYVNGQLHRIDGPAIEYANGTKSWWVNGVHHRVDGPAIEWANGDKWWWVNGVRHREDGPAKENVNGDKEWYLNDNEYSKKTYYKKIKKLIIKNIGLETASMFMFDKKNAWKRMETRALADFLEEKGDIKTANQIRSLIKFALS